MLTANEKRKLLTKIQKEKLRLATQMLKATAKQPGVKIEVSPIIEGRATVKCTYNGLEKIYLIN